MRRHARSRGLARPAFAALLAAGAAAPAAASEEEIALLRQQLEALQERLEQLETDQAETRDGIEREAVRVGDTPGSFKLPGSDTSVTIGGYVKADAIFDTSHSLGDTGNVGNIVPGGDEESRFRAHARQTRFNIRTSTPSDWGPVNTLIEGDFFGGGGNEAFSNSTPFRLRHAYAEVGPIGAGQFWTLFMPIESYPVTVDFQGPVGIPFIRQAQFRYTHPVNEKLTLAASLENSEFTGRNDAGIFAESVNVGIRAGVDVAPDAVLAGIWQDDWGLAKLAGVGRVLSSPTGGSDDEEFAWGVNASGNIALWEGGKLLGSFTYGDGVGRYIVDGFGQDAFVNASGGLETIESWGAVAGVSQAISSQVAAGLTFGHYQVEDTFGPDDLDNLQSVHASLFWRPVERVTLGLEALYGRRENADGLDGDNLRLQTAVQVNF
ncbi:MAG: DcaP family trimeric outer membrane transporter [Paracoccaceae bacterium]